MTDTDRPDYPTAAELEALAARIPEEIHFGTSTWTYPGWKGLVYSRDRRRRAEYELLGFTTYGHPMDLYAEQLARLRVVRSTDLARHVGRSVLCAGMLTTSKPVHTAKDEPMEFATFDDGHGLIETVLFPRVYRERGHILFDQGPFLFRGKVEEEFGAISVTITRLERLERLRQGARTEV